MKLRGLLVMIILCISAGYFVNRKGVRLRITAKENKIQPQYLINYMIWRLIIKWSME